MKPRVSEYATPQRYKKKFEPPSNSENIFEEARKIRTHHFPFFVYICAGTD